MFAPDIFAKVFQKVFKEYSNDRLSEKYPLGFIRFKKVFKIGYSQGLFCEISSPNSIRMRILLGGVRALASICWGFNLYPDRLDNVVTTQNRIVPMAATSLMFLSVSSFVFVRMILS